MENQIFRSLVTVAQEIENYRNILSCYNHFIASYESKQNSAAKAQVQLNKEIIRKSLSALYAEHSTIVATTRESILTESKSAVMNNYIITPLENRAIELFYQK